MSDNSPARKALIILSSARELPLSQPTNHPPISTGFFLIELAQVLKEFGDSHDFTFCTPDGAEPQLDVNGLSLPFMATHRFSGALISQMLGPDSFARRRPDLVARRDAELLLAARHLGELSLSRALPKTDPEVAATRDKVARVLAGRPRPRYLSAQTVVERHRDRDDAFSLADFDFIHFPGGHAPMVDFKDSPWLGEIINLAFEHSVILSLICHAPIAMTSAALRIDESGIPRPTPDHPFRGAKLTTVSKFGELIALTTNYPKVPGKTTRLPYYLDEVLSASGYSVVLPLNPAAAKVVWEPHLHLLTSNGPYSIDIHVERLREAVDVKVRQPTI
ncbi:hypothetical protein [Agrobacterium deltaense]|uniref:hypothetical protein n=1 Tax=Agrobacterium deltaense TaxID=1183412 RepID=UPI000F63AD4D|nr:hypothetical protein [Agrobacterium deltaense]RRN74623.1 hypothetical protein EIQ31_06010 [Agrobacterium deltaense]